MPQTSMDVNKGQKVELRASYNTDASSDLSQNTIIWNFVTESTQLVRNWMGDPMYSHTWESLK